MGDSYVKLIFAYLTPMICNIETDIWNKHSTTYHTTWQSQARVRNARVLQKSRRFVPKLNRADISLRVLFVLAAVPYNENGHWN